MMASPKNSHQAKVVATVIGFLAIGLLTIGAPNLRQANTPSLNLAKLPGVSSREVVTNCSARNASEWRSCLSRATSNRPMRILIDGMIACSSAEPCEGTIRNRSAPLLIYSSSSNRSGFKRSANAALRPLLNILHSTDVTVQGLAFEENASCLSAMSSGLGTPGVLSAVSSNRVTIHSVSIVQAAGSGISFSDVYQGVVLNSRIIGSCSIGVAIGAPGAGWGDRPFQPQFDIIGNTIAGSGGAGVYLLGQGTIDQPSRIEANVFEGNGEGLVAEGPARHLRIAGNTFLRSSGGFFGGHGIALIDSSIQPHQLKSLELSQNTFCGNGGLDLFRSGEKLRTCDEFRLANNRLTASCGSSSSLRVSVSCSKM